MPEIVGVRFQHAGKSYYFSSQGMKFQVGDPVIVSTVNGLEFGEVSISNREIEETALRSELKPVVRLANERDFKILEDNKKLEARALAFCAERIRFRQMDMSLTSVECAFDHSKLLFYFTSEDRVDFRELVKDLAGEFRMRIELRQIGVRDEARLLGGLGICGREYCCKTFLNDFTNVTIKMAKGQGLSLNPSKISGACGRLMCCIANEMESYEYLAEITPKVGSVVQFNPDNTQKIGVVQEANLISGSLRIRPKDSEVSIFLHKSDVVVLKNGNGKINRDCFEYVEMGDPVPKACYNKKSTLASSLASSSRGDSLTPEFSSDSSALAGYSYDDAPIEFKKRSELPRSRKKMEKDMKNIEETETISEGTNNKNGGGFKKNAGGKKYPQQNGKPMKKNFKYAHEHEDGDIAPEIADKIPREKKPYQKNNRGYRNQKNNFRHNKNNHREEKNSNE